MAEKRMFSKSIIDTDAFLDMPCSAQSLYFHLAMRADDDGFVANPKRIQKIVGSADDDLKILIAKRYVLTFNSGVIVIKHWKLHNYIPKDRYKETLYVEEKNTLSIKKNGAYTDCIQDVDSLDTQSRLDKSRLDKSRLERDAQARFVPPSLIQIKSYCQEKGLKTNPERFFNFYNSNGWMVGKNKMTDWQASIDAWESRDNEEARYSGEELKGVVVDYEVFKGGGYL